MIGLARPFVEEMKKKGENIQGLGHLIKNINNPDMRVKIMKEYAKKYFKATPHLDYALKSKLTKKERQSHLNGLLYRHMLC
jgi:ATP citrate (pro-S)-lyase